MAETKEYTIETSLTLDYRKSRWGLERLVLDGVSNHLPNDSNGTTVSVKLKQEGTFYELHNVDRTKPVEEIIFEDNGSGYDAKLLSVLFSTKSADVLSVGQFGEGLKLVASTALRENVDLEYQSRNWLAKPKAKQETIDEHTLDRLCFDIIENGHNIQGSRTVIRNPSEQVLDQVFAIPQKILALNRNYTELHNEKNNYILSDPYLKYFNFDKIISYGTPKQKYHSRIIDMHPAEEPEQEIVPGHKTRAQKSRYLFVKGVRINNIPALFDYDLGLDDITPDRSSGNEEEIIEEIGSLVQDCRNQEVIKTILKRAKAYPSGQDYELQSFLPKEERDRTSHDIFHRRKESIFREKENPLSTKLKEKTKDTNHPWYQAFISLYGEKAVLAEEYDSFTNSDAERIGYTPIRLHTGIARFLAKKGIAQAKDVAGPRQNNEYHWISLEDLTTQERTTYDRKNDINRKLAVEIPPQVRIYQGLYDSHGKEIETGLAVQITEPNGTKYIGVKRSQLQHTAQFDESYTHELGHYITGKQDGDTGFTRFFINELVKLVQEDD